MYAVYFLRSIVKMISQVFLFSISSQLQIHLLLLAFFCLLKWHRRQTRPQHHVSLCIRSIKNNSKLAETPWKCACIPTANIWKSWLKNTMIRFILHQLYFRAYKTHSKVCRWVGPFYKKALDGCCHARMCTRVMSLMLEPCKRWWEDIPWKKSLSVIWSVKTLYSLWRG